MTERRTTARTRMLKGAKITIGNRWSVADCQYIMDQPAHLSRHFRPSSARSRLPAPVSFEPCTVPTDHGFGPNDRQRVSNIGKR